jgi:hypothetical protein
MSPNEQLTRQEAEQVRLIEARRRGIQSGMVGVSQQILLNDITALLAVVNRLAGK